MLKGISPLISPELLRILAEMGHGDEIVLADAHFPGHTLGAEVIRADGVPVEPLLEGILDLSPLDTYSDPLTMMAVVEGDELDPAVEADYMTVVQQYESGAAAPARIDRLEFYQRAMEAFAVVITGETRKYGNIILKKGLVE